MIKRTKNQEVNNMSNTISQRWNDMGLMHHPVGQVNEKIKNRAAQGLGALNGAVQGLCDGFNHGSILRRAADGAERGAQKAKAKRGGLFYALLIPRTIYDLAIALFKVIAQAFNPRNDFKAQRLGREAANHWNNVGALWDRAFDFHGEYA